VLCSKGKRQSPISIDATKLLFDPYLTQLHVDPNKVDVYCRLEKHSDGRTNKWKICSPLVHKFDAGIAV